MSLKTTHEKLIPHISGANGIINYTYLYITIHRLLPSSVWLVQTLKKNYISTWTSRKLYFNDISGAINIYSVKYVNIQSMYGIHTDTQLHVGEW